MTHPYVDVILFYHCTGMLSICSRPGLRLLYSIISIGLLVFYQIDEHFILNLILLIFYVADANFLAGAQAEMPCSGFNMHTH